MRKVLIIILFLILLTACSGQDINNFEENSEKLVKVALLKEEIKDRVLNYTGIIASESIKKLGYKSSGKLKKVYINKGDYIAKGDKIAELDTEDLKIALAASKAQLDAAKAQLDKAIKGATDEDIENANLNMKKAKDAYDFAVDSFNNVEKLYKDGAISKQDYDKAKLQLDIRETEYNQAVQLYNQVLNGAREEDKRAAEAAWEQANLDYEYKKNLLEDATLISDIDGYIVDVLYEEGELVPQGYPVVVIRNNNQVVKVGLSQKDIFKVNLKDKAEIIFNGEKAEGIITNISDVPDNQTRTYEAEITLLQNEYKIGLVVQANIIIGEEKGIWVPITSIMTDGEDYVFIVNNDGVERKKIIIEEIRGDMVKVKGLEVGHKLVIENMKEIKAGDKVKIILDTKE